MEREEDENENEIENENKDDHEVFIQCCILLHRDLKTYINENSLPLLEKMSMNSLEEFVDEI
jgi:hypothetical protein